jgi:DNA-binding transcriptional regulator YdaS (Cro superfamily)
MKLKTYLKQRPGNAARLAVATDSHTPDVYRWAKEPHEDGYRPVPVEKCLPIEIHTGGKVGRKDLRKNDYWLIWPDLQKPKKAA